jgi:hypothetical protein
MTAGERLSAIRVKIKRAKKHSIDLGDEIQVFFDSKPYTIKPEFQLKPPQVLYRLTKATPAPIAIATITGDVLHSLRSALDHLAYQLVHIGTGGAGPFEHVYFPIADSPEKYETSKVRKVEGMREEAVKAIDAIKPYKGGNDTLWRLHRLNIINKHRLILMIGNALYGVDITHRRRRNGLLPLERVFDYPVKRLALVKEGDVLLTEGPRLNVDYYLQFPFDVAFGEPGVLESESVFETLQQMCDLIDNVVSSFRLLLA